MAAVALAMGLGMAALPSTALAHSERPARNPPNVDSNHVPVHRAVDPDDAHLLVVCKPESEQVIRAWPAAWQYLKDLDLRLLRKCGYHDLQAAVDAVVTRGSTIALLPGLYLEDPSAVPPAAGSHCADLLAQVAANPAISHADQLACPHTTQLVNIMGDPDSTAPDGTGGYDCDGRLCDLQVEGMGRDPLDVLFDNKFRRLNTIRADRAFGVYFRNFTLQHSEFNGIYVLETDGYVFDSLLSRWDLEYGYLSFTVDHGLYVNCETYGNGDSGVYPGGQAQRFGYRPSVEVDHCSTHHNTAGTSGTAGDSVYFHDNLIYDNMTGIANDSLVPRHPGVPQNSGTYVRNQVFSNNEDFFEYARNGTCNHPLSQINFDAGVVCPSFIFPTGVGVMAAGGNFNIYAENSFYDNWRMGTMLFTVPAALREDNDPTHQLDNSHANRYYHNYMGYAPAGTAHGRVHPNGLDFWWDEGGVLNCWQENVPAPGHQLYSDPPYNTESVNPPSIGGRPTGPALGAALPTCSPAANPAANYALNPVKGGLEASCAPYELHTNPDPVGCPWDHAPVAPADYVSTGYGPAPGQHFGPAPTGWSLGWVNPPREPAAASTSPPGSLPNTAGTASTAVLVVIAVFGAGLLVGRARRRRVDA